MINVVQKRHFQLTKKFPKEETFGLTSQIERSVNGMGVCLAERSGKIAFEQKTHYTNMAILLRLNLKSFHWVYLLFTLSLPLVNP